jgi:hypothetical protein
MPMLNRLQILCSCFALLCVACALDAMPRSQRKTAQEPEDSWKPEGAEGTNRGASGTQPLADAAAPMDKPADAQTQRDPADNAANGAGTNAPATRDPNSAGDAAQPTTDMSTSMNTPAAGSGGAISAPAGASGSAGAAGAAGAESENVRQSLIDAAIEALGGGASDGGGMEPWRSGGQQGGGLSADFVRSVLFSMVASGVCFRDVRRCVEMCIVISTDCKPCSADPECATALMNVCGPLGTCAP